MTATDHPFPCSPQTACVAVVRHSAADVETVFRAVREALVAMSAEDTAVDAARSRAEATFRVFFFRDEVSAEVRPGGLPGATGGSVLYVRSRSRVGRYDLGVNARRMRGLLRRVAALSGPLADPATATAR